MTAGHLLLIHNIPIRSHKAFYPREGGTPLLYSVSQHPLQLGPVVIASLRSLIVSWYNPWKHAPLPPPRDISILQGPDLSDEKTRAEIEQLRVEILDQRSWRTKLLLSLLIPIGGTLAFLNTWHTD